MKVFRGMASSAAVDARRAIEGDDDTEFTPVVAEGVEAVVPLRDATATILHGLVGGLRSGMSYSAARTLREFHRKARLCPFYASDSTADLRTLDHARREAIG